MQLGGARAALGRAAARMLRHVVGLGWLGAGFMRSLRVAHADVSKWHGARERLGGARALDAC